MYWYMQRMYLVCTSTYLVHHDTHLYLTISAEHMLILTGELVHHLHQVGKSCMMKTQPALLAPRVCLLQGSAFSETGHHAKHPPGGFAGYLSVEVPKSDVNGLDRDLVFHEASINLHHNC